MNQDERRALKIIKGKHSEIGMTEERLESLFKEYLKAKEISLENETTAVETYYPKPEEIVENFLSWLKANLPYVVLGER